MARRIGIYPGTFNPVHEGHIGFCLEATRECKLDKVLILPESSPREKHGVAPMAQRVAWLKKAVQPYSQLEVMTLEQERFTVRATLPQLQQLLPGAHLTLLVGSDVVRTFSYRWPQLEVLLEQMTLAIGLRGGDTPDDMVEIIQACEMAYDMKVDYRLLYSPHAYVASSQLRTRLGGLAPE